MNQIYFEPIKVWFKFDFEAGWFWENDVTTVNVQQDACKHQNILPIPHFTIWHAFKLLFDVDNNMCYDLNSSKTSRRSCLIDLAHGRHLILDSPTKSLTYMKVEQWTKSPQTGLPPKLPHVSKSKQIQSHVSWFSVPELFWECYTSSTPSTPIAILSDLIWFGEEVVVVDLWPLERGLILTWRATQTQNHARAISFPSSQAAHLEWMLHKLRYESSHLIFFKKLSSSIIQGCQSVSQ